MKVIEVLSEISDKDLPILSEILKLYQNSNDEIKHFPKDHKEEIYYLKHMSKINNSKYIKEIYWAEECINKLDFLIHIKISFRNKKATLYIKCSEVLEHKKEKMLLKILTDEAKKIIKEIE